MGYARDDVWEKSNGYCNICGKSLVKDNGVVGQRGAWHVDHSNPRARGGTDSIRNLNVVCAKCNIKKSHSYRSLSEAREDTQAKSIGGKIIDGLNRIKKDDSLFGNLPDILDGFAGASRTRNWKL